MSSERELWNKVLVSLSDLAKRNVNNALCNEQSAVDYLTDENMEDGLLSLDAVVIKEILDKAKEQGIDVKHRPDLHYINYTAESVQEKEYKWYCVLHELPESVLKELRDWGHYDWWNNDQLTDQQKDQLHDQMRLKSVYDPDVKDQMVKLLIQQMECGCDGLESLSMETCGEILMRAVGFGLLKP